ncbi:MAG: hypothetical protein QQW96_22125 [Tychonema bourrellyi B0820]|nr:hypothetical protein [Tychonema bourrellyi]MDQ2100334.1 hypothetical protein [Tychonema bourrellyi B0820]
MTSVKSVTQSFAELSSFKFQKALECVSEFSESIALFPRLVTDP